MPVNNPFIVDQGRGIAGAVDAYQQGKERAQNYRLVEEQAQRQRDQDNRKKAFIDAASAANKSGNPEVIAQLHTDFPEFSQQVTARQKYLSEATKQNAIQSAQKALSALDIGDTKRATNVLNQRAKMLTESGGDPSDTIYLINKIKQDPELAKAVLENQLRADAGVDAYLKARGIGGSGKLQSAVNIPGLGAQTIDQSGNVALKQLPEEDQKKIAEFNAAKKERELSQLEKKESTKLNAKYLAETTKTIGQTAAQARRTRPKLDDLKKALSAIETGKLAEAKAFFGPYLPDNLKPDDLANVQAASAALNDFALTELSRFQGPTTDQELNFVREVIASLGNTPEANRIIIDRMERFLNDSIDEQEQFKKWRKTGGKDPNDFVFERTPLPEILGASQQRVAPAPQQQAPQRALDWLKSNPDLIGAFEQKYGYRPEGY